MKQAMFMVSEFHRKHGAPELDRVATAEEIKVRRVLRLNLIDEEVSELEEALGLGGQEHPPAPDLVAIADALADLAYVTIGAALEWGIPLDRVFSEVHRSNMTKTPGPVRGDGKILKGEGYEPPRIAEVLAMQGTGDPMSDQREAVERAGMVLHRHECRDQMCAAKECDLVAWPRDRQESADVALARAVIALDADVRRLRDEQFKTPRITPYQRGSIASALRNLRHLYEQMLVAGIVRDTKLAATGLLGPAIEWIESVQTEIDAVDGLNPPAPSSPGASEPSKADVEAVARRMYLAGAGYEHDGGKFIDERWLKLSREAIRLGADPSKAGQP